MAEGIDHNDFNWRRRGLCKDEEPELFFPVGTGTQAMFQVEEAQVVCRRCPISKICLEWALQTGQADGVWGGVDMDLERNKKRARLKSLDQSTQPTNAEVAELLITQSKNLAKNRGDVVA